MPRAPFIPTPAHLARQADAKRFGVRQVGKPAPGFYAVRLRKGAVEVAALIEYGPTRDPDTGDVLDRSWHWSAMVNGVADPDPAPEPNDLVWRVYEFGRRIERAEYEFLLADRHWAAEHAPELPEAKPREPVSLNAMKPLF